MSSSTHPDHEQQPPGETKQEDPLIEPSSSGNTKQDPPTEQAAPSDVKPTTATEQSALTESDPAPKSTNEEPATSDQPHEAHPEAAAEKGKSTITELASSAATTATTAALGMKDNVFSMFGGGAKKEKKEEPKDDPDEASGSAKAQKESEAEAAGEVSVLPPNVEFSDSTLTSTLLIGRGAGVPRCTFRARGSPDGKG